MTDYRATFERRGAAYDRAMQRAPEVRSEEFRLPVERLGVRPGEVVIDVPSGGGYLARHLPHGCTWHGHDPCAAFHGADPALGGDLLPLPWPDAFADVGVSIAGLHHLHDKCALFREFARVLEPGGRLLIADVHRDSPVAGFLDDFVGACNSTGHDGLYLDVSTCRELEQAGFMVDDATMLRYCWQFPSRQAMVAFCTELFDLRVAPAVTAKAIESRLGTTATAGTGVGMHWELYAVLARRV